MERFKVRLARGERLLDRMLDAGIALEHECGGTLACASCCIIERAAAGERGSRLACQAIAGGGAVVVAIPARKIPPRATGSCPVSVTASAAKFLAAQLAKHPGAVAVRLSVQPSGCSGFGYRIDPADSIREGDGVFESGAVRIAVDALSLPYLQGATVDLVQEGLARRLRFENPNAVQSCGCGESFAT